jgi:hypothetical protein
VEPEGVVNALRKISRILVPGGLLLESHPLAGSSVEAAGRVLGALDEREFGRVLDAMERSVAVLVDDGRLALRDERAFEVPMRFDTGAELLAEVVTWEGTTISVRLQRAIKPIETPLALRIASVVRLYTSGSTRSPTRTRPGSSTSP